MSIDIWHNFLKIYSADPISHWLKKRDIFWCSIEIQCKYFPVEPDEEDILKFTKTDPKNLIGKVKIILQTMKSHLVFNNEKFYSDTRGTELKVIQS